MSLVVLFVLMVLALQVPALCPDVLDIPAHAPDLYVLVVMYIALRAPRYQATFWGILIGVVRDAVSLDALGTNAFVLGLLAFVFCEGRRERGRILGLHRIAFVFLGALTAGWTYLVRSLPLGKGMVQWIQFVDAVPTALWTALLAAALYPLFDRYRLLDDLCRGTRALPA